ncbi:MAG TPA: hypothetical protein IAA23_02920 [Candidatus Helicobacter avistercoris]|nr:hypothetical protein [Candidatus Helicobacter avistercoris]
MRSRIVATSLNFQNWFDSSNRYPDTNTPKNRDFVVQRMEKLNLNQSVNLIGENFLPKIQANFKAMPILIISQIFSTILNATQCFCVLGLGFKGLELKE